MICMGALKDDSLATVIVLVTEALDDAYERMEHK